MGVVGEVVGTVKLVAEVITKRQNLRKEERDEITNLLDHIADSILQFTDAVRASSPNTSRAIAEFATYVRYFEVAARRNKVMDAGTSERVRELMEQAYVSDRAFDSPFERELDNLRKSETKSQALWTTQSSSFPTPFWPPDLTTAWSENAEETLAQIDKAAGEIKGVSNLIRARFRET